MNPPPDFSKVPEHEVVYWAQKGHEAARTELHRRYKGPVHTLLFHMFDDHDVAEELTQVTFFKAFQGLESYDPELKFSAWIFSIANHVGVDDHRKKRLDRGPSPQRRHLIPRPEVIQAGLRVPFLPREVFLF